MTWGVKYIIIVKNQVGIYFMKFWETKYFKAVKVLFLFCFILLLLLYFSIYLLLPYFLNKKDYSTQITDFVKNNTGLIFIVDNYKLSVSPQLNMVFKTKSAQLFYPDKRQILDIKNVQADFSIFCLLLKELKINSISADEFQFSTKLLKNGKTTFQQYLDKNAKKNDINFSYAKKIPKISIKKYIIKINDEKSGQKFKLAGNNFSVFQNVDYRYLNIQMQGILYCFDKKYLSYKAKFAVPKTIISKFGNKIFDISFDNIYRQNFYAEMDSDVKIHTNNDKFDYLSGKINIDNLTLKLGNKVLPPSYFHIILNKGRASLVSKFYTNINETADISADLKLKKPYEIKINCRCPKADINNLQQLAVPVLELLKIKNNLNEFNVQGSVSSDFTINTDLKNIISNGSLNISNAKVSHKNIPFNIEGINAKIDFSNNNINLVKSDFLINNQPLKASGKINSNAVGDILISAKNLDIKNLLKAFPQFNLKNIILNSGKLAFQARLKGKLTDCSPEIKTSVENLSGYETTKNVKFSAKNIVTDIKVIKDSVDGSAIFSGFTCDLSALFKTSNLIHSDKISVRFNKNDLILDKSKFYSGNSNFILSGVTKNYSDKAETTLIGSGVIDTLFIKNLIKDKNMILYNKGVLPASFNVSYFKDKLSINAKILANRQNYITPVHINNLIGTNSLLNIIVRFQNNVLFIDDICLYFANDINNVNKNINVSRLKKVISLKGLVKNINSNNPCMQNVRIKTDEILNLSVQGFKNSSISFFADLILNNYVNSPILSGFAGFKDLKIPDYNLAAQNVDFVFNKKDISAKINNLKINNMNISLDSVLPVDFLKSKKINSVNLYADFLDMDYLTSLKYLFEQQDFYPGMSIPYEILSGKLNLKSFKSGNFRAENITGDIALNKNILHIKNIFASAYGGKIAGNAVYNVPFSSLKTEIQGRNLNAQLFAKSFLPQKQQLSGRLNFDASLMMLGDKAEQQMKTLTGSADVVVQNGHLGQLGRFEHFLYAQNLLSQRLIYTNLNNTIRAVSPKDTGHFTYMKGVLKFKNGYVYLNPLTTTGPQMSMYITGFMNLFANNVDLQILGRVSSDVSTSLGVLGTMTIKDFLDEHTKYGKNIPEAYNAVNSELPEVDISKIPALYPDLKYQTKNFKVLISGDSESVKSVKSFTWVNPIGTKKKLSEENLNDISPNTQNVKDVQMQNQPENPTQSSGQVEKKLPEQSQKQDTVLDKNTPDFLENIPDNFN